MELKQYKKQFFSRRKECAWLNQLGAQGYRLIGRKDTRYQFLYDPEKCWYYQLEWLDHAPDSEQMQDYLQAYEQNGIFLAASYSLWAYFVSDVPFIKSETGIRRTGIHYRNLAFFLYIVSAISSVLIGYHISICTFLQTNGVLIEEPKLELTEKFFPDLWRRICFGAQVIFHSYTQLWTNLFGKTKATELLSVLIPLAAICAVFGALMHSEYLKYRAIRRIVKQRDDIKTEDCLTDGKKVAKMKSQDHKESLHQVVKEFSLEPIFEPDDIDERFITRSDTSRPGLPLAGFFKDFENERIQIIGNMEHSYLSSLPLAQRRESLDAFFSCHVVMVIVTAGLPIFPEMAELAQKHRTPLYRSMQRTSSLMAALTAGLNVSLAERITTHGVLVEVYGEGILILGESGIGKSETAIELVKRGHRLIADDAVQLKRVSDKTLVGSAPDLIKHYIELRGIGIVDVCRIFGMGAVKDTEKVDLAIHYEQWDAEKQYERFGLDTEYTDILGIKIPSITIPVKPGRNLAVIIEIAAMNNRQKKMGYNTAEEFNKRLMEFNR